MEAEQIWSCLPAILTSFNGVTGTVRPLVKIHYKDGSHIDFPEIQKVQVITPCTAFAGMRLPVRVGDKVILHIADRDIQKLLNKTTTAGLGDPESQISQTRRFHNISDAIAYTGFSSHDSVHFEQEYQYDTWIFNNTDSNSYNHIRLKQNGDIEVKTLKATVTLEKGGDIEAVNDKVTALLENSGDISVTNDACSLTMDNDGDIRANNAVASVDIKSDGQILSKNTLGSIDLGVTGNVIVKSPLNIRLDAPEVTCTGDLTIYDGSIRMSSHTHAGVLSGPASTAPPNNPS